MVSLTLNCLVSEQVYYYWLYVFLKNIKILYRKYKIIQNTVWLEKYQFIVYVVHGVLMPQLLKIYIRVVPLNGIFILLGYFFMILSGVLVSLVFGITLKKLFPKIYAVLTGGRI